jgi:hypothetical protein
MVVVPGTSTVSTPVVVIVATVVTVLLHVPPPVRSVRVVVVPGHRLALPDIIPGSGLTVTIVVTVQPEPKE